MGQTHSTLTGSELHIARSNVSTGTPVGNQSAGIIGELYWDSTNNKLYIAEATGTANWVDANVSGDQWTELIDTASSITADGHVKGNSGGTALEFGQAVDTTDSPTFSSLTVTGTINDTTVLTSNNNTLLGSGAGPALTSSNNTAVGISALSVATGAAGNTAIGFQALQDNLSANDNTAIGSRSLANNTTGARNTGVGFQALFLNTTGSDNYAFGATSLPSNTTGSFNIGIGKGALIGNALGEGNIAIGTDAAVSMVSAASTGFNTIIGHLTGNGIITGVENTIIGAKVSGLSSTLSNNIILSDGAGNIRLQFDSSGDGAIGGGLEVTGAFKDSSGDVGTSGQMLASTVTGTNWVAAGGNVSNTGTPLDNQIAVWTDSTTIEGDAGLTWSGSTFAIAHTSTVISSVTSSGTVAFSDARVVNDTGQAAIIQIGSSAQIDTFAGITNANITKFITNSDNLVIGTFDQDSPIIFVTNTVERMRLTSTGLTVDGTINNATLDDDATLFNLLVGASAGAAITTGTQNTAVGHQALAAVTNTGNNTAVGYQALLVNVNVDNTAVGHKALVANEGGAFNTAVGSSALLANDTGDSNVAIGLSSLLANTSGDSNIAIGVFALTSNSVGRRNVAIGERAGIDIISATVTGENTLIGYNTGSGIETGVQNTVLGANVSGLAATLSNNIILADGAGAIRLQSDSSGNLTIGGTINNATLIDSTTFSSLFVGANAGAAATSAEDNTAIGDNALITNISAQGNTAVGTDALRRSTTGSSNVSIGSDTLSFNTTGSNNVALGDEALALNTTGDGNIAVGSDALVFNLLGRRNTAIGTGAGRNVVSVTLTGENTFLGYETGLGITTGVQNTVIGANVSGLSAALSNNVIIADGAGVVRIQVDSSGEVDVKTNKIINLVDPTAAQHAATKNYVDTAGGGNVSNTGTPVDNQLAIWTDATTIEGNSGLTYDGSTFAFAVGSGNVLQTITTLGTTSTAGFFLFNDSGKFTGMQVLGSGMGGTFAGLPSANLSKFVSSGDNFVIASDSASSSPIVFAPIAAEAMRLTTAGFMALGSTAADTLFHAISTGADTTAVLTTETTGTNAGEYKTFVGSQNPDGNVTGAGGDIYVRDSAALSNMFFNKEATTGTNWETVSILPSSVTQLFSTTDYSDLGTASVITTTDATRSLRFHSTVASSTRHVIAQTSGNEAELQFIDPTEGNQMIYTGSSTFITSTSGGDITMQNSALIAATSGTKLFDYVGEGKLAGVDIIDITQSANLAQWDLGTIGRASTAEVGPIVTISGVSAIVDTTAGLVLDSLSIFAIESTFFDQSDEAGAATLFTINDSSYKEGRATFGALFGHLYSGEHLTRINPGLPNDYRVNVFNINMILAGSAAIFDTSGTAATAFTAVSNNSTASTVINSVTDSSGVASFVHAGTSPFLGSLVTVGGFTSNPDYNTTGIVTATSATTFEVDYIEFGSTEVGAYTVTGVTIAATAHGLTTVGTGVTLDTTLSVAYDGGYLIYNIQTNSFDVPATFSATQAGTWSTKGLDQSDPRVFAFNNPSTADSTVLAFGGDNNNSSATTITNGTYVAIAVTGFDQDAVSERFKLTSETAGIWTLTALEDFKGTLAGGLWALKTGSTANYRFAMSTNGSVPVFASARYSPMEVKTTKVGIPLQFNVELSEGDTIQLMVAGDSTSDPLTVTDVTFGIQ